MVFLLPIPGQDIIIHHDPLLEVRDIRPAIHLVILDESGPFSSHIAPTVLTPSITQPLDLVRSVEVTIFYLTQLSDKLLLSHKHSR